MAKLELPLKHLHDMTDEELKTHIEALEHITAVLKKEWQTAWKEYDKRKREGKKGGF